MTERIIFSPGGSEDEGRWHMLPSRLPQERSQTAFGKRGVLREPWKEAASQEGCPMPPWQVVQASVRIRSWMALLFKVA